MAKTIRLLITLLFLSLSVPLLSTPASAADAALAVSSPVSVVLGEETLSLPAYSIGGNNYFRLNDLAYMVRNTEARFSVEWSEQEQTIRLVTGEINQRASERTPEAGLSRPCAPTRATLLLNGWPTDFTGYTIDSVNYYKLRDIMSALDVSVAWDGEHRAIRLNPSVPYAPDAPVPAPGNTILTVEEIADLAASAVLIRAYDADGEELGQGSGFFVRQDGRIATCFHVLDHPTLDKIEVTTDDGSIYLVNTILAYHPGTDLALLRVNGIANAKPLTLGDSSPLTRGKRVAVIASPFAMRNTVADGIISGFRDNLELRDAGRIDIQITTPVSSGSSGGAMFDFFGNVVGVIYAKHVFAENANFSIPVNDLKELMASLRPISLRTFRAEVAALAEERERAQEEESEKDDRTAASALPSQVHPFTMIET